MMMQPTLVKSLSGISDSTVSLSSSGNTNEETQLADDKQTPPAATVRRTRTLPARSISMPRRALRTSSHLGGKWSQPANGENQTPRPAAPLERVRRLPGRSISMKGFRPTTPVEKRSSFGDQEAPQPEKEEMVRRLPARTNSMPKKTIWKDKGGQSRYVLHDEPPPSQIQPVGLATVAKEKLADAVFTGGAAGLAVLDAVTATKRRFVDRQLSQKRLDESDTSSSQNEASEGPEVAEGRFAQCRRGLMRRAKSLGAIRGDGVAAMPQQTECPERSAVATVAA